MKKNIEKNFKQIHNYIKIIFFLMGSFFFTTAWSQNSDIFIDDTLKAAQLNPRLVQRFPILDAI